MLRSVKISTISYNTDKWLNNVLNELVDSRQIRYYMWINHAPEEDELSYHKHLVVCPDERIDTRNLDDKLEEPDPDNVFPHSR